MTRPKCIECKVGVKENEKAGSVRCSQCDRWCHVGCTNLVPEALKNIWDTYDATGHHWWACEGCTKAYMSLTKRMMAYERDMAELRKEVADTTAMATAANSKVDEVVKEVEEVKKSRKDDMAATIDEATKRMSAELRERESRKDNIVVYGLNEPPFDVKGKDRKEIDTVSIQDLLDDMKVEASAKSDVKFSYRIGELMNNVHEKPRPLCVGFRSQTVKDNVFKAATNLSKSKDFYRVSIVPDLTVQQREEDKELMKECDRKNANLSEEDQGNWIFRCVGMKGTRTIARMRVHKDGARGRGGQRGRPPTTGANSLPLRGRQRTPSPPESDSETEEMNGWATVDQVASRPNKRRPSHSPGTSPDLPSQAKKASQRTQKRGKQTNN